MSVLTPLRVTLRRSVDEPTTPAEWHVGLNHAGAFPANEVGCPCAKGRCGLAIPRPGAFCTAHWGTSEYLQVHSAENCVPRKWFRRYKE